MEHHYPIFSFFFGSSRRGQERDEEEERRERTEEDNEMDDDDVPPLESLSNPHSQQDVDMAPPDAAQPQPQVQVSAPAPQHHRVTVEEVPDEDATPPSSSATSAYSTPLLTPSVTVPFQRSSTRRPRVDEDDDHERDRRHPSERVVAGSAADSLRSAVERDMRRREGNDNSQDGSSIRSVAADHSSIIPQSQSQNQQPQPQQQPPGTGLNPTVFVLPHMTVLLPAAIVPAFIPGAGIRPVVVLDATSITPASPATRTASSAPSTQTFAPSHTATPAAPTTTPAPSMSTSAPTSSTNENDIGSSFRFFTHGSRGVGLGLSTPGPSSQSTSSQPQQQQEPQQQPAQPQQAAPTVAEQPQAQQTPREQAQRDMEAELRTHFEAADGFFNRVFGGLGTGVVQIEVGTVPLHEAPPFMGMAGAPAPDANAANPNANPNPNPNTPPNNATPNPNPQADPTADQRPIFLDHLLRSLTQTTGFPFFFNLAQGEREVDDPERAKRFIRGLESVPEGLVRRLERVGKMVEEGEGGCGDGGCAVCWERLLDEEEEGEAQDGEQGHEHEEGEEEEGKEDKKEKEEDAPLPKIVSLPCAHVFHSRCLIPWFSKPRQTTCPTCRFNIDPEGLMKRTPRPVEETEEPEVPTEPNSPVVERDVQDGQLHGQPAQPQQAQPQAQQPQQPTQPQQPQQPPPPLPSPGRDFVSLGIGFDIIIGVQPNVGAGAGPQGALGMLLRLAADQARQHQEQQGQQQQQQQGHEQEQEREGELGEGEMEEMIIDGVDEQEVLENFRRRLEEREDARREAQLPPTSSPQPSQSGAQGNAPSQPSTPSPAQGNGNGNEARPQPHAHPRVVHGGFRLPGITMVGGTGARPLGDMLSAIFGGFPRHDQGQGQAQAQGQAQVQQGQAQRQQGQGQPQLPEQHQQIHDRLAQEILEGEQRIQYIRERTQQLREALDREGVPHTPATAPAPAQGDNPNANASPNATPNPNPGAAPRRGHRHVFGFDIPLGMPMPMGFAPHPRRRRSETKKTWTLPPAPGLSLRQRIEKKEQEAGLRCSEISCGIGPSDEDPMIAEAEHSLKQLSIHDKANVSRAVCKHKFHSSCLVTAERVVLDGADVPVIGEDVEVSCPVCKSGGCVSKRDWEEGVKALQ